MRIADVLYGHGLDNWQGGIPPVARFLHELETFVWHRCMQCKRQLQLARASYRLHSVAVRFQYTTWKDAYGSPCMQCKCKLASCMLAALLCFALIRSPSIDTVLQNTV